MRACQRFIGCLVNGRWRLTSGREIKLSELRGRAGGRHFGHGMYVLFVRRCGAELLMAKDGFIYASRRLAGRRRFVSLSTKRIKSAACIRVYKECIHALVHADSFVCSQEIAESSIDQR